MRRRYYLASRKRLTHLNNPTVQARTIWRAVYGEPWPKGWRVIWCAPMGGYMGSCSYGERLIRLCYKSFAKPHYQTAYESRRLYVGGSGHVHVGMERRWEFGPEIDAHSPVRRVEERSVIEVLLHEFTHLRNRKLRHGEEFSRLVRWGLSRLGLDHLHHLA
jgi:hypothetical protein